MIAIFTDRKGFKKSEFIHAPSPVWRIPEPPQIEVVPKNNDDVLYGPITKTITFFLDVIKEVNGEEIAFYSEK